MSAFNDIDKHLKHYWALEHHHNPLRLAQLTWVQQWQKQRMQRIHAPLFNQPSHQLMAQYFMQRLYGGPDFPLLAKQFERATRIGHKIEKIIPNSAILTATRGIELAVLALELDEDMAKALFNDTQDPAQFQPTDEQIRALSEHFNQKESRLHQMALLEQLGLALDHYMRSFVVQSAFKLAKNTAYKHDFKQVYDFIAEGFAAMKPLKSAAEFINQFTALEREGIERTWSGHADPFFHND